MKSRKGFTLVELMVVILIVGILAAVAIPLMQGRIDKAKWSEGNAAAGTIRTSIRAYCAETSIATAVSNLVGETLDDSTVQGLLGFGAADLTGTYFMAADYTVTSVNATTGIASITVAGGRNANSPAGSYLLEEDGDWTKQ